MQTSRRAPLWPALAVGLLAAGTGVWGSHLDRHTLQLDAPPFVGQWDLRLPARALVPVALGVGAVGMSPRLQRLPWPRLLGATWLLAVGWAVSLAAVDGVAGFTRPLLLRDDYLHDVPRVHAGFLRSFTDHVVSGPERWTTHVGGHPPGLLLLLKGFDAVGLGGAWPAAVLFVAAGTSAVVAVLLTVRALVDERSARACAPFLALAPAAVWVAVSADALFLGVTAWGVALLALRRPLLGGLVLGGSLLLTYGALPLGLLALVAARSRRAVAVAAGGVVAVVAAFAAAGFWWFDGLHQTYLRVHAGAGGYRPLQYFVVANLAALAVAAGPATAVGLRGLGRGDRRWWVVAPVLVAPGGARGGGGGPARGGGGGGGARAPRLWWVVAPVLVGVLVADLSGATRGEVERVWLPFVPWLVVATARVVHPRPWLAAQVATGLVVQLVLRSKW